MKISQAFTMTALVGSLAVSTLAEDLKIKGDIRLRDEIAIEKDKDTRNRSRIRARLGVYKQVNEQVDVGLALLSGGSDPVSGNETMSGYGSSKDIKIDLAYVNVKSGYGLSALAGKTKNPYKVSNKSELVWDGDYHPEGISIQYAYEMGDLALDARLNSAWLIESKTEGQDLMQSGMQINATQKLGDLSFGAGASVVEIHNERNDGGLKGTPAYDGDSFGNTCALEDSEGNCLAIGTDMRIFNPYVEVNSKGSLPWSAYVDFAMNDREDDNNKAISVGLGLGKAKKPMTFAFKYIYKEVQANSVLGSLTDSDFAGGGTGGSGHEFAAKVALLENTFFGISHFLNFQDATPLLGEGELTGDNLVNKTQIDLVVTF